MSDSQQRQRMVMGAVPVLLTLLLLSCSRTPVSEYVASDEVGELSARHGEQISRLLRDCFGTPVLPRMAKVSLPEEGEEDEAHRHPVHLVEEEAAKESKDGDGIGEGRDINM